MPMLRPEDAPEAFQSAWNVHDMESFGDLFVDNATFVNRFGHYVRGVHGDDAAIIHFWSRLTTGPAHPAGAHKIDTLILAVLTRRDGVWRFQAVENVTLTNPRTGEIVLRDDPRHR